jgi:hypothetical protein
MGGDPGADGHQGQRTRTQSANALANCAVVSVQRAEQLVSLGEPPGVRRFMHITGIPHEPIHQTFTARLPTAGPRETKRKFMGDAQKLCRNRTEFVRKAT